MWLDPGAWLCGAAGPSCLGSHSVQPQGWNLLAPVSWSHASQDTRNPVYPRSLQGWVILDHREVPQLLTLQLLSSSADRMMEPHFFPGTPLREERQK